MKPLLLLLALAACRSSGDSSASRDGGPSAGPAVGASVLEFHNHIDRDGFFVDEALTRAAATRMHLDATFDGTVRGNVYASPLYVESGPSGKGAFYLVTEDDNVYALDEGTGKPLWQKTVGAPAQQSGAGCGNISPLGITGTPAIDLASRLIVFDAVTADGQGNIATHAIHALSIDDGSERWMLDVATLKDPTGHLFSPQVQNQRSAVLIVGGVAYVAYGGHAGDCNDYRGWLVGVPLGDPSGVKTYATPSAGAGLWAPGGPASDARASSQSQATEWGAAARHGQEASASTDSTPSWPLRRTAPTIGYRRTGTSWMSTTSTSAALARSSSTPPE